jgi:hypothetical protein
MDSTFKFGTLPECVGVLDDIDLFALSNTQYTNKRSIHIPITIDGVKYETNQIPNMEWAVSVSQQTRIHVFFPAMIHKDGHKYANRVPNDDQHLFYKKLVLPALQSTVNKVDASTIFLDSRLRQNFLMGRGSGLRFPKITVQREYLESLWETIVNLLDDTPDCAKFKGMFCMGSSVGTKHQFRVHLRNTSWTPCGVSEYRRAKNPNSIPLSGFDFVDVGFEYIVSEDKQCLLWNIDAVGRYLAALGFSVNQREFLGIFGIGGVDATPKRSSSYHGKICYVQLYLKISDLTKTHMDSGSSGTQGFNIQDMQSNNTVFQSKIKTMISCIENGQSNWWGWRLEVRGLPNVAEALTDHIAANFDLWSASIDKMTVSIDSKLICGMMSASLTAISLLVKLGFEKKSEYPALEESFHSFCCYLMIRLIHSSCLNAETNLFKLDTGKFFRLLFWSRQTENCWSIQCLRSQGNTTQCLQSQQTHSQF